MITRMKGVVIILGLIFLTAAADGATHVSAVARRGLDAPVAVTAEGTGTPSPTQVMAPSARVVPTAAAADSRLGARSRIPVQTVTSPTASPAAPGSDQRSISNKPGIGAPEGELRDLKSRGQVADWQTEQDQAEPGPAPASVDPMDPTSDPEEASPVGVVPVGTSEPTPPIPTIAPPAPSSPSDVGQGRWIDVDLTRQLLTAYEESTPVRSVAVSTGLAGTPTPVGQFRIWVKFRSDDMEGPGYYLPDVPYTMYFHGGYGLHGTYWHSNFGHPMSHGCVNLPTPEAEWLFSWAEVGTLVNVHN